MVSLSLALFALGLTAPGQPIRSGADCRHLPVVSAPPATPNDNRVRAGTMRGGVLTVRLVARPAAWRPEGSTGCALSVTAFAEEGQPARIPGPLIRVRAGTRVSARVRNALDTPIWVRGLQDRLPGSRLDATQVLPGESREFSYVATVAGPRLYWANRTKSDTISGNIDGQLVGAMVVDSAIADQLEPPSDRVLVLTRWKSDGTSFNDGYQINAVNGLSWPHSEPLRYAAGDSVRWRVINASNALHEMHLHGFYFRLDARGYQVVDTGRTAPLSIVGEMRVTVVMRTGDWLNMAWKAERTGNWLFHCHILAHMNGDQRLSRIPGDVVQAGHAHSGSEMSEAGHHDMAGLVVPVEIRASRTPGARAPVLVPDASRRAIDLYADVRPRVFGEHDGYGFVMQENRVVPARDSIRIPGSKLVLRRGEPVRITVHNRLRQAISVHWHGIELESFNDGVGGFSGDAARIAPPIAAEDSFVVRFTPPRAGTFMYHVHGERGEELASGLYGPLIVLDSGETASAAERTVFIANGGPGARRPFFINGSATPDTLELVAGTQNRVRMLFLMSNHVATMTLRGAGTPARLGRTAQDGYQQPNLLPLLPKFSTGPGHIYDLEISPTAPGMLWLDVEHAISSGVTGVPVTTLPIRVR